MSDMRILMIGDIVGRPGRKIVEDLLPRFVDESRIDFCVANVENASGGSGVTPKIADRLFEVKVDAMTTGDHVYKKREIFGYLRSSGRIVRPANYPSASHGKGAVVVEANNGVKIGVLSLQGRVFMPPIDCPFQAAEKEVAELRKKAQIVLVDFHAEATSEKIAMGWHLDGKASAVVGTHTHIQTADNVVLPKGTAYITDLGMTGPYNSVIGRATDKVLYKFLTNMPTRYDVGEGMEKLCGVILTIDPETGRARDIERVMLNGL